MCSIIEYYCNETVLLYNYTIVHEEINFKKVCWSLKQGKFNILE